ncbi:aconitate hydratase [Alteraurantiacibacter buctensis]|uniref:Aconitate hydratase A n=1 Tax=Alteraurantiacibacter buctensis TaxID=1503981 RepID=A0A844Z2V5_9SPHN|nr:aconitate hydratase AcnA [Alteraurantiacibacter buctensis]MXO72847.1 aconitate hydratase AcnA [Alteraurantiacibacter buctensis]
MDRLPTAWDKLDADVTARLSSLPRSLRLLLENALAHGAPPSVAGQFAAWLDGRRDALEVPFLPTRILMQDTAGVAALVDLAALRDRATHPVDALVPIDLVIDHSLKVDFSGTADAADRNLDLEFRRNTERYAFFKWAEQAFERFRVVPPGNGICHQVNLERLASIALRQDGPDPMVVPEIVIGTDSHTTMINALGILGWGVGGLDAEMAALGQVAQLSLPQVTEVRLNGRLAPGVTATDAALALTAFLRNAGVVAHILEMTGDGAASLSLPDRAAMANMSPEYGATACLFAVDGETLRYLRAAGRSEADLALYEAYARQSGLWAGGPQRHYDQVLSFDLGAVQPVMAGPARPQDVLPLRQIPASLPQSGAPADGAVFIAAITSCTNTANPVLMVQAGLVARRARELGLSLPPWVKASLAPGSRAMADLLQRAGLLDDLAALGFALVGFGCTTCVGNSGDLLPAARTMLEANPGMVGAAVLSGNRNFPNRIHPDLRANYLASPPLVVAAALAGSLALDLATQAIGTDMAGKPALLADLWPQHGAAEALLARLEEAPPQAPALFEAPQWRDLPAPGGSRYPWDRQSLILRPPPFFSEADACRFGVIADAAPLLVLGDNVTTDHISPIGRLARDCPAARWLREQGWSQPGFGSYGDFRGNHEVMLRGTFDNARLDNALVAGEGSRTLDASGKECSIFDAAMSFIAAGTPVIVWAGEAYGCGSARDWAAKGTALLGIRVVIAHSFERIHRSNLVAMGVLPITVPRACSIAPGADDRLDIIGLDRLDVRSGLEIVIRSTARHSVKGIAELHTSEEVQVLAQGGVPRILAAQVSKPLDC